MLFDECETCVLSFTIFFGAKGAMLCMNRKIKKIIMLNEIERIKDKANSRCSINLCMFVEAHPIDEN